MAGCLSVPLLRACTRVGWPLISKSAVLYSRRARLHATAVAAVAEGAHTPASAAVQAQQLPAVGPPPTVPFSAAAANAVALSGTVLSDPQLHVFAPNQYAAHVRLGLRPRTYRPSLPQQPQGVASVDCFGALALQLAQHVQKGSRIQVRGALREDVWADKATGEPRRMLKIIAEELALLAPAEEHDEPHQGPQQQYYQATEQQQAQQAVEQPQRQPKPARSGVRYSPSAEHSRSMYERFGDSLVGISAARGIKLSTVIDHLTAAGWAGALSSWQRLAGDLLLGPPGSPDWLSPAEVAEAVDAVQREHPEMSLAQLPMRAIRQRLEEGPAAAKVARQIAGRDGDPALLYGAIKLVCAMLEQGVSFSLVHTPPPPNGAATSVEAAPHVAVPDDGPPF